MSEPACAGRRASSVDFSRAISPRLRAAYPALPQGPSLRSGLCCPSPPSLSRPHPSHSQAHRDFAAQRLIRDAFAVLLPRRPLAGVGLLGRSVWALTRVQPRFQAEGVLTMRTTLSASTYDSDDRIRAFSKDLLTRIEHLPGVSHVGLANYLPMSRFGGSRSGRAEGGCRRHAGRSSRRSICTSTTCATRPAHESSRPAGRSTR